MNVVVFTFTLHIAGYSWNSKEGFILKTMVKMGCPTSGKQNFALFWFFNGQKLFSCNLIFPFPTFEYQFRLHMNIERTHSQIVRSLSIQQILWYKQSRNYNRSFQPVHNIYLCLLHCMFVHCLRFFNCSVFRALRMGYRSTIHMYALLRIVTRNSIWLHGEQLTHSVRTQIEML